MAKQKTPFKDIYEFMGNNLSLDKMREVYKSIKDNGESPMIFHQMMFSHYCNNSHYEELIGEDVFFLENNPKNVDRKERFTHLRGEQINKSSNHLNSKVMKNYERMGLNLPENMYAVRTAIDGLQPIIDEIKQKYNGDARAFAYDYFDEEIGFEKYEVDEIVDDLLKGICKFKSAFEQFKVDGFAASSKILDEVLENQPIEKRQEYLACMLTALEGIQKEKVTQEDLDVLLDENKQKSLEELKAEVSAKLEDCIGSITSSFFDKFNPEKKEITLEELNEVKIDANADIDTEEHQLNVALALYIAQLKGDVDYFTENGANAELTGMAAAAGVAADYATNQFVNGEVKFETWQKWMKYILGGLFMVAVATLGVLATVAIGLSIVAVLMGMFGQGIISAMIALLISVYFSKITIEKIFEFVDWFLQKIERPYDNFVLKVTAWVKAKMAALKKEKGEEEILTEVPTEQLGSEPAMETTEQEEQPESEKKNNGNYSEDIEKLLSE